MFCSVCEHCVRAKAPVEFGVFDITVPQQTQAAMGASVTALVMSEDEVEAALKLGASDATTSAAAFETAKGRFDVVLNCASGKIDGGLVGLD